MMDELRIGTWALLQEASDPWWSVALSWLQRVVWDPKAAVSEMPFWFYFLVIGLGIFVGAILVGAGKKLG